MLQVAVNTIEGYLLKLEPDLLIVRVAVESLQLFLGVVCYALPRLTAAPVDLPVVGQDRVVVGTVVAINTLSLEEIHTNVHGV